MRKWVSVLAGLCSMLPPTALAVDELVEAERQFRADVAELGLREGFLHHLIEESVVFRPLPVSARAWFEAQPTPPFTLEWQPWYAEMAASGDFGYTIGAWVSRPLVDAEEEEEKEDEADDADDAEAADEEDEAEPAPASHGHYLTVWIKGEDGQWHLLADHGIGGISEPVARESIEDRGEVQRSEPIAGSFALNTRYQGLMAATLRLPMAQAERAVERSWLADDVLLLRPGQTLIQGHEAVRLLVSGELGASAPALVVMAASGDLGMSLGGESGPGTYLRLWRHVDGPGWVLAAEVATPLQMEDAEPED